MNARIRFSTSEIRERISPSEVKGLQLLNLAMLGGLVIFALLLLLIYIPMGQTTPPSPDNRMFLELMRWVFIFSALLGILVFSRFPTIWFRPSRLQKLLQDMSAGDQEQDPENTLKIFFQLYRQQLLIRLFILEGVALFGLVLLSFYISMGYEGSGPFILILLAPLFVFIFFTFRNFPQRERIASFIEEHIQRKLH